ncbi:MAG TPA: asparaginase [Gemmatimonadota bacterium]|nr:asparaginase [Gemmatimonadota bacterium]
MTGPAGVRVWRGNEVESLHRIHAAVVEGGRVVRRHGEPDSRAYLRSSAKPLQVLPLVEEGLVERYGFTPREIAVMAASHSGEPFHLDAVRSILEKADLSEEDLRCGGHEPFHVPTTEALRRSGEPPHALHDNCSGKHAGMLAVCRAMGWPLESYREPGHPLQRRIHTTLAEMAGMPEGEIGIAVDGCGVPTFVLPVAGMARAWAALAQADAERADDRARAVGRIFDAMAAHPEYVAGTGRMDTDVMVEAGGRVVVKAGAEGVFCAAIRAADGRAPAGLALKVADGARRAQDPALVALLAELGLVDPASERLAAHARPTIVNRTGTVVGRIDARIPLEPA